MTDRLEGLNLAGLFELALEGGDGGSPVAGGSGEDPAPGGEPEQSSLLIGSDGPVEPRAKILRGGQVEALVETRDHFRRRLLVGTMFILLGVGVFLARDLLLTPPPTQVWQRLAVIGVAATAGAALYWRPSASWRQLRLTEILLFWATALWFAADRYHYTWSAAVREDASGVLFAIAFAVLFYFALTVGYGIVVPNTWWRALRVTALTAAMPFAIVGLLYLRAPAAFDFVRRTMSLAQLTSLVLMLAIGFGLAAVGTHRLHFLREAAVAARQLGQYRLVRRIGKGGMGEVWEAEHALLARPAAVKVIRPEMVDARDPERSSAILRSFEREARATAMLRSVHTVELYDFGGTDDGAFYYVMELLDGYDLDSLIRGFGPMPAARVVHLLLQACDSLADAHEAGIVHRDVKPSNIHVCRMGHTYDHVKILDFGLVRSWGAGADTLAAPADRRRIAGTPSFMAPELIRCEGRIDGRADIYALGCVGYWALTASVVFPGDDRGEVLRQHLEGTPMPPSRRTEGYVPRELEEVVLACLEKDPALRPRTAMELFDRLTACEIGDSWTQARARDWWERHDPSRLAEQAMLCR